MRRRDVPAGAEPAEARPGVRGAPLLALLLVAAAATPPPGSPHFTFAASGTDQLLIPYLSPALDAERARLASAGASVPETTEVVVVPDVRALSALSNEAGAATPAVCAGGKLALASPRAAVGGYPWLDAAVREYARCAGAGAAGARPATFPVRWRGEASPKPADTRPAAVRDFARLGDILQARGRGEPARIEYEKAIRRGGSSDPDTVARWAQASMAAGKAKAVEDPLRAAAREHPRNAAVQAALGDLEGRREAWPAARDAYLAAIGVDPFDAGAHAGLASALEKTGDASGASREKKIAEMLRR